MFTINNYLSSSISPRLSSSLKDISFKQFRRTYPGNYSINFSNCLSATNDFSVKNYSNFYLTNKYKISDILEQPKNEIKSNYIFGSMMLGRSFLAFSEIDPSPYAKSYKYQQRYDYGCPIFIESEGPTTELTVKILDSNKCHIYYTKNYKKYYLCTDENNTVIFCKESLLSFNLSSTNPQDLIYLYSSDTQSIILFKNTGSGTYTFRKTQNLLELTKIIENDSYSYLSNSFSLEKPLYTPINSVVDTSFITYNDDNTIDNNSSTFNLTNNLLLHRKSSYNNPTEITVLKNQLTQIDIFSTSNNLLTGLHTSSFSDQFREYTSIGNNIKEETTEDLELNYVFYNKSYNIYPGANTFISPSSLYPYESININDTKFIESGAFSYVTPDYADKVYHISNNSKDYENGQFLLYTWLSGSSNSSEKIWIDRYYYPDLITKSDALSGKNNFNTTYENELDRLILSNSDLYNNLNIIKFFDKISDFTFQPNQTYRYDRISMPIIPKLQSSFTYCNNYSPIYPYNYFKTINESGEMSIGFNFMGDENDWIIQSDRNDIDSGIVIEKRNNVVYLKYKIYDATNNFYDNTDNSWASYEISSDVKPLKSNYILFSIDSKTGVGYFFVNDEIIYTFNLDSYQFTTKQLLYGDVFIIKNGIKTNILSNDILDIQDVFISDYYIEKDLAFTIPLLNGSIKIDDITITLPCGMRNSSDNIEYLQTICGASSFKSNNINIYIKNLNIGNESVLTGLKESVATLMPNILPANSQLNNIEFQNFK